MPTWTEQRDRYLENLHLKDQVEMLKKALESQEKQIDRLKKRLDAVHRRSIWEHFLAKVFEA